MGSETLGANFQEILEEEEKKLKEKKVLLDKRPGHTEIPDNILSGQEYLNLLNHEENPKKEN